jgi:O-antigen/teichoic acid export membrane protein
MGIEKTSTLSAATHGTLWAYVQNWVARGITLVVFFALARLLTPTEFGAFAVTMVFLTVGEIFVEHLFAHALIQRELLSPEHINVAFWATLFCGLIMVLVTLFGASFFARKFDAPSIEPLIMAMSPVFLFMAASSIPAALLRRSLDYRTLARRTGLSNFISGGVAIGAAIAGLGVWAFVLQVLCFNAVGTFILWRRESWRPQWQFSNQALKDLAGFSVRITFVKLLDLAETRVVELIIGNSLGLTALGNYALAARAQQAASQLLAAPLWESSVAVFSRQQKNSQALSQALEQRCVLAATFVVPAFLFAAAAAQALIPAVFGVKWHSAVLPFQILCVLGAVRAVAFLYGCVLQGIGEGNASVYMAGVRLLLILGSMPLLLKYGASGVAAALLMGQLLSMPFAFRLMRQKTGLKASTLLGQLFAPWLAGSVASLAGWGLCQQSALSHVPDVITAALSLGLSGLIFLWIMGILMPETLLIYTRRLPGFFGQFLRAWLQKMVHYKTKFHALCLMFLMNLAAPARVSSNEKSGVIVWGSNHSKACEKVSLEGLLSLLDRSGAKHATLLGFGLFRPNFSGQLALNEAPDWGQFFPTFVRSKTLAQAQTLVILGEGREHFDTLFRLKVIAFCEKRGVPVFHAEGALDGASWLTPTNHGALHEQVTQWSSRVDASATGHLIGWEIPAEPTSLVLEASAHVITKLVTEQSAKVVILSLDDHPSINSVIALHDSLPEAVRTRVLLLRGQFASAAEAAQCFQGFDFLKLAQPALMLVALSQAVPLLVDADGDASGSSDQLAQLKIWSLTGACLLSASEASDAQQLYTRLQQQLTHRHEIRATLHASGQSAKNTLAVALAACLNQRTST